MTDAIRDERPARPAAAPLPRLALVAVDLVAVVAFAVIGRASHGLGLDLMGILESAAPFLAGLAIAWALLVATRLDPRSIVPGWLAVWLVTVAGGLGIRLALGGTAAIAFVIVTAVVLGPLLLLPRAASALIRRSSARRSA